MNMIFDLPCQTDTLIGTSNDVATMQPHISCIVNVAVSQLRVKKKNIWNNAHIGVGRPCRLGLQKADQTVFFTE